jgi:hypothetical protein
MSPEDLLRDRAATTSGCTCMWINDVEPTRIDEYIHAIEHDVVPLYRKHGVDLVGAWRGGFGLGRHQVLLLVDYHDMGRYEALYGDPEYYEMDSRIGFNGMRKNTGWMLRPLGFMAGP